MPFNILFYILLIIFFLFSGVYVFLKYKKYSGIFFLISVIFLAIWAILYISIFGLIIEKDILLYIFRFMYSLSFLGMYSMLLFIHFFGQIIKQSVIKKNILYYLIIFILFIFSSFVVDDLKYIVDKNYYFEVYGYGYKLILFCYLLFLPAFLFIYYLKNKKLSYINKIRLKIITIGFAVFMFFSILFYVILPFFGKFYFEDSAVMFSLPFIFGVLYSTNSYNFSDIKIRLGRIIIFLLSIFYSVIIINVLKYYSDKVPENFSTFWGFSKEFGTIDLVFGIILYLSSYYLLSKVFLGSNNLNFFEKKINSFKKYIPYISSISELNIFLQKNFLGLFKIKFIKIKLFNKNSQSLELYKYFSKDLSRDLFMNDIVFIEENKYKFSIKKINEEVLEKTYLIFPLINNKNEVVGILELGHKPFNDMYTKEEITVLKGFIEFIVGQLKYIGIYSKINDLNINLDKKIDEKTIQNNELINRQNEFIGIISHEIKTPLSTSIFQVDSLIDDIKEGEDNMQYVKKELLMIEKQLEKVSSLTNSLFVNQRYDLGKIELFKEATNIETFLYLEIEGFQKKYSNIIFEIDIIDNIGEIQLDKVQFTQVISNLITNAIKFASKEKKIISINAYLEGNNVIIDIEDNGKGFEDIDTSLIFDKYNTGKKSTVGIGMGLYLCNKIVGLHNGSINVSNSKKLGGAMFKITLKKN